MTDGKHCPACGKDVGLWLVCYAPAELWAAAYLRRTKLLTRADGRGGNERE
ncbi:MAG TPA: hypothetical protein VGF55_15805 [Gemmataceae bacterium]|jgi:hypothetical protein